MNKGNGYEWIATYCECECKWMQIVQHARAPFAPRWSVRPCDPSGFPSGWDGNALLKAVKLPRPE